MVDIEGHNAFSDSRVVRGTGGGQGFVEPVDSGGSWNRWRTGVRGTGGLRGFVEPVEDTNPLSGLNDPLDRIFLEKKHRRLIGGVVMDRPHLRCSMDLGDESVEK